MSKKIELPSFDLLCHVTYIKKGKQKQNSKKNLKNYNSEHSSHLRYTFDKKN